MKTKPIISSLLLAGCLTITVGAMAEGDAAEDKQALARTPKALVELLQNASFLPPQEYKEKMQSERDAHYFSIGLEQLAQKLDEATDPRRDINAEQMQAYEWNNAGTVVLGIACLVILGELVSNRIRMRLIHGAGSGRSGGD